MFLSVSPWHMIRYLLPTPPGNWLGLLRQSQEIIQLLDPQTRSLPSTQPRAAVNSCTSCIITPYLHFFPLLICEWDTKHTAWEPCFKTVTHINNFQEFSVLWVLKNIFILSENSQLLFPAHPSLPAGRAHCFLLRTWHRSWAVMVPWGHSQSSWAGPLNFPTPSPFCLNTWSLLPEDFSSSICIFPTCPKQLSFLLSLELTFNLDPSLNNSPSVGRELIFHLSFPNAFLDKGTWFTSWRHTIFYRG